MYPLIALLSALLLFPAAALQWDSGAHVQQDSVHDSQAPIALTPAHDNQVRVPIVLGVMSRCPDALLCESVFDGVLKNTWDIVAISLSFIGKINASDPEFGVTCMHGPTECQGNIHELCAMRSARTQQDWWHFVQCLNFEGKEEVGNRALAKRCAGVAYIPWGDEDKQNNKSGGVDERLMTRGSGGIQSCVDGPEGKALLKASVKQTQRLGIEKSCTIMISGKTRCIHDGTWKECETGHSVEEIVCYIRAEHRKLNSHQNSEENQKPWPNDTIST